jgi:hypothetical protein
LSSPTHPRFVVAIVFALSVNVSSATDPPRPVVADDRRFGRAVDNDDDGSPLQSVSN